MSLKRSHIVHSQNVELSLEQEEKAYQWQSRIFKGFDQSLHQEMAEVFDHYCEDGEYLEIDRMELDLGSISEKHFEEEFRNRFTEALHHFLENRLHTTKYRRSVGHDYYARRLIEYLGKGYEDHSLGIGKMDDWMKSSLGLGPSFLNDLRDLGKSEQVRKRLVYSFSDESLELLTKQLDKRHGETIVYYERNLRGIHREKPILSLSEGDFRNALWKVILAYLFVEAGSFYGRKQVLKYIIQGLAAEHRYEYKAFLGELIRGVESLSQLHFEQGDLLEILKQLGEEGAKSEGKPEDRKEELAARLRQWLDYWCRNASFPQGISPDFRADLRRYRELDPAALKTMWRKLFRSTERLYHLLEPLFSDQELYDLLKFSESRNFYALRTGIEELSRRLEGKISYASAWKRFLEQRRGKVFYSMLSAYQEQEKFMLESLAEVLEEDQLAREYHLRENDFLDQLREFWPFDGEKTKASGTSTQVVEPYFVNRSDDGRKLPGKTLEAWYAKLREQLRPLTEILRSGDLENPEIQEFLKGLKTFGETSGLNWEEFGPQLYQLGHQMFPDNTKELKTMFLGAETEQQAYWEAPQLEPYYRSMLVQWRRIREIYLQKEQNVIVYDLLQKSAEVRNLSLKDLLKSLADFIDKKEEWAEAKDWLDLFKKHWSGKIESFAERQTQEHFRNQARLKQYLLELSQKERTGNDQELLWDLWFLVGELGGDGRYARQNLIRMMNNMIQSDPMLDQKLGDAIRALSVTMKSWEKTLAYGRDVCEAYISSGELPWWSDNTSLGQLKSFAEELLENEEEGFERKKMSVVELSRWFTLLSPRSIQKVLLDRFPELRPGVTEPSLEMIEAIALALKGLAPDYVEQLRKSYQHLIELLEKYPRTTRTMMIRRSKQWLSGIWGMTQGQVIYFSKSTEATSEELEGLLESSLKIEELLPEMDRIKKKLYLENYRRQLLERLSEEDFRKLSFELVDQSQVMQLERVWKLLDLLSRHLTLTQHEQIKRNFLDLFLKKQSLLAVKQWKIADWSVLLYTSVDQLAFVQGDDLFRKLRQTNPHKGLEPLLRLLDTDRPDQLPREQKQDRPYRKLGEEEEEQEGEELFVDGAGVVILGPFLSPLFERMELLKEGQFVDEESLFYAIRTLHYAVSGQREGVEPEMVMYKIICGIDIHTPIRMDQELSQQHMDLVDGLLGAVIQQWSILKETTVDGLRETFLNRKGKLSLVDDEHVILRVEKGTFDMLLDHIPWGISQLKLSWMEKRIQVIWR
ncbi:MAG: hypothetical protein EP338_08955 [Bacteroidetes bacterium]|nr:MAG: hypothetical protein EP338_08955 [Bacteroidota bacterium]